MSFGSVTAAREVETTGANAPRRSLVGSRSARPGDCIAKDLADALFHAMCSFMFATRFDAAQDRKNLRRHDLRDWPRAQRRHDERKQPLALFIGSLGKLAALLRQPLRCNGLERVLGRELHAHFLSFAFHRGIAPQLQECSCLIATSTRFRQRNLRIHAER